MNEFNKIDLREIYRCLRLITKGGTTPYSCHTIALCKKTHSMIDNYCEHEWEYGCRASYQCTNCLELKKDE